MALSSIYTRPTGTSSPGYFTGPTSAEAVNPQISLRFAMVLNSSSVQGGGVLGVTFSLTNTLDQSNNVTGAGNWELTNGSESSGSDSIGWNCAQNDVFRIEVIAGYYGPGNFSRGSPLDVMKWLPPFGPNECGYYIRPANNSAQVLTVPPNNQNYYDFKLNGDSAWWVTASELAALNSPCVPYNGTYHCEKTAGQEATMRETMILEIPLFAGSSGIFTVVGGTEWGDLEVLHFYVGPTATQTASSSTAAATGPTYTINGLTCHVPIAYQSYRSVIYLLPMVTSNPRFVNLTSGLPFVFGNAENITGRTQQIGNQPPVHLPDALEMVFYSMGPNTSCGEYEGLQETTIDVQVPIQNGAYNMTGTTFNGLPG